jgi:peptidyl-prolyl cis-trans isomerase B (cyclophilin B)
MENVEKEKAVIETKIGKLVIEFFPKEAPKHVENFKKLAETGFYNGTTFHRVIPGFMIQGGDPNSKDSDRSRHGTGGPGYTIKAEFNSISHKRGIVSMARSSDPNSAGSQFFICVKDSVFLDRQYTVFGKVIDGMDVADKIASEKRDERDNPLEKIAMTKVYIEKK